MISFKENCNSADTLCMTAVTAPGKESNLDYSSAKMYDFGSIGSFDLGYLTSAQVGKNVPFEVKRVYWTYLTPSNVMRGNHAHRRLKQIIFAISGEIEIEIESPDRQRTKHLLSQPRFGLYIPEFHWRTLKFGSGAVLLSLASLDYDEAEYIRDYVEFEKLCSK